MAMGASFLPFALIYALWRVNGGSQWYVLALPLLGGALAGFATKLFMDHRWTPSIERLPLIIRDVFADSAIGASPVIYADTHYKIWVIGGENRQAIAAPYSSTANTAAQMFETSINARAAA
jgi:hypothetical protein